MNGAQRAAFIALIKAADEMSSLLLSQAKYAIPLVNGPGALHERYDAARNRYFELEAEARKAKSSARKSRGDVRQKAG